MKKALLLFTVTVVIIFNSVGFFAIGQNILPEGENPSVIHASDEVGNGAFDVGSTHVAGIEADNPISMTYFTILVASMIFMLLIINKTNQY